MDITDLMIGDLVEDPNFGYVTVVGIGFCEGVPTVELMIDQSTCTAVAATQIKPILLTKEMFKKNGIMIGAGESVKGYNLLASKNGYFWIEDHCLIKFKYVHEFQHILKSCDISITFELK